MSCVAVLLPQLACIVLFEVISYLFIAHLYSLIHLFLIPPIIISLQTSSLFMWTTHCRAYTTNFLVNSPMNRCVFYIRVYIESCTPISRILTRWKNFRWWHLNVTEITVKTGLNAKQEVADTTLFSPYLIVLSINGNAEWFCEQLPPVCLWVFKFFAGLFKVWVFKRADGHVSHYFVVFSLYWKNICQFVRCYDLAK